MPITIASAYRAASSGRMLTWTPPSTTGTPRLGNGPPAHTPAASPREHADAHQVRGLVQGNRIDALIHQAELDFGFLAAEAASVVSVRAPRGPTSAARRSELVHVGVGHDEQHSHQSRPLASLREICRETPGTSRTAWPAWRA